MDLDIRELIGEVEGPVSPTDIPLHNISKPQWNLKREQPKHRLIVELKAKGYDDTEIAKMVDGSRFMVRNVTKQPFAQPILLNAIHRNVQQLDKQVAEIVSEGALEGAKLLLETIKDTTAKRSDRITSSQEFLNRRYGKPNQPVNRETDVDLNTMSIAQIAAELPKTQTANAEDGSSSPTQTNS